MTRMRRDGVRRRDAIRTQEVRALLVTFLLGAVVPGCAGPGANNPSATGADTAHDTATHRSVLRGMEVSAEGRVTRIRLDTSPQPRHRLTGSADAAAIELDLYDVTVEGLPPRVEVGDGTVQSLEVRALGEGSVQIIARLAAPAEGRVASWEGGLDLLVDPRPVAAEMETRSPSAVSERIVRPLAGGAGVAFDLGNEPSSVSAFVLSDGRRLVVDAEGVKISEPQITEEFTEGPVERVRIGRQEGRVRAVVEGRTAGVFAEYRVEKRPHGFAVLITPETAEKNTREPLAKNDEPSPAASMETKNPAPAVDVSAYPGGGRVTDLGFRREPDRSRVEIEMSKPAPHEVRKVTGERVVVDLLHTTLPDAFRRALDTSAFPGPVQLVAAYPKGADTRIVVDLRGPAPFRLEREASRMALIFEGGGPPPSQGGQEATPGGQEFVVVKGEKAKGAPSVPGEKAAAKEPGAAAGKIYTGRRLSMDFVDADIRNILRLIGDVSGLNIVAGDGVQGKVTVRLMDVPWDQALDVILKTRGLDQVREGNVIRIAPAERLAQERSRAAEAAKAAEEQEPLVTDIIPVNYASANELVDKVQSVLTQRGSVSVDQRTNALLIKDVRSQLEEARALITRLDTQTPQVLIEARIVEVASTFSRDLGVQWGGQFTADTAHGNATDWAFPHSIDLVGDTGEGNFAVNFPSAGGLGGGPGGALALTLGHVNDVLTLDLRLSAIETSGRGRVISSPRVTTLDNKTAEILQGTEIPFTTATEEKIETQSIDYLLKLNVTPHVTSDRSIIMQIQVTKDAPSTTFFAVDSNTPAVETRAATTEVLVKDGETTVIGGIITDTRGHSESAVPFLSKVPFMGWMFKKKDDRDDKTELIIFITPKITTATSVARNM